MLFLIDRTRACLPQVGVPDSIRKYPTFSRNTQPEFSILLFVLVVKSFWCFCLFYYRNFLLLTLQLHVIYVPISLYFIDCNVIYLFHRMFTFSTCCYILIDPLMFWCHSFTFIMTCKWVYDSICCKFLQTSDCIYMCFIWRLLKLLTKRLHLNELENKRLLLPNSINLVLRNAFNKSWLLGRSWTWFKETLL